MPYHSHCTGSRGLEVCACGREGPRPAAHCAAGLEAFEKMLLACDNLMGSLQLGIETKRAGLPAAHSRSLGPGGKGTSGQNDSQRALVYFLGAKVTADNLTAHE